MEPEFVARIWGARTLAPLFAEKHNLTEPVGEVWMTGDKCRVAAGPYAGKTLTEVWPSLPAEWKGSISQQGAFPLLIKFLFPKEKLSLQVHPNDEYAQRHEADRGGTGKTEMWYVIYAAEDAGVRVNLKPGTTPSSFRRAVADGSAEECLEFIPLHTGDVIFVPAGTAHTIGPGLVLCEIQQNSDITYRVFDYNRLDAKGELRELHLEKSLAVMNFSEQIGGRMSPISSSRGCVKETFYVACRHFATERWEFTDRLDAVTSEDHFDILIFLEGEGSIEVSGEHLAYAPAHVWLIPASLGAYQLSPSKPTTILRTYVPGDLRDLAQRFHDKGIAEGEWSHLVYP